MLTVTPVNNEDGTATVTVTGSAGGVVNVYFGRFDMGRLTWVFLTSHVGDAASVVPLADGYWLFYAVEGVTVSDVDGCPVTSDVTAILTAVRNSIAEAINELGLGLAGGVVQQWAPNEINARCPCVILTHEGTTPSRDQKFIGTSDVGYPVRVMIADRTDKYDSRNMPRYDLWRQKIANRFDGQRLPGVRTVMICQVEEDVYSENPQQAYEFMVSHLVIRVFSRQTVGVP